MVSAEYTLALGVLTLPEIDPVLEPNKERRAGTVRSWNPEFDGATAASVGICTARTLMEHRSGVVRSWNLEFDGATVASFGICTARTLTSSSATLAPLLRGLAPCPAQFERQRPLGCRISTRCGATEGAPEPI